MRIRVAMTLGLGAATFGWTQLCEKDFYLQSMRQSTFEGPSIAALEKKADKNLKPNGSDMPILHLAMNYKFMTGFEGRCNSEKTDIHYFHKASGAGGYSPVTESSTYVKLYDTTTVIPGMNYDFWFGFSEPQDSLRFVVAHEKGDTEPGFSNFYAAALFRDSTRDASSGLWTETYRFFHLSGPLDSATLATQFMENSGWKNLEFGANRKGWFTFHFFRAVYDTVAPAPVARRDGMSGGLNIRASALGIRVDAPALAAEGAVLEVRDLSGRAVARLQPQSQGYVWQSRQTNARPGLYCLTHRGRALGKFLLKPTE